MDPLNALSASELEFLAENELVSIEPLTKLDLIPLIQDEIGPFTPPRSINVPLWLAIVIKKRGMCKIKPPGWLTVEYLGSKHKMESSQQGFSDMPFHYMAMSKLLLDSGSDDIPDITAVRTLLQDIREVRRSKMKMGVEYLTRSHIQLNNLSGMEINEIRPTFASGFECAKRIQSANSRHTPAASRSNALTSSHGSTSHPGFQSFNQY